MLETRVFLQKKTISFAVFTALFSFAFFQSRPLGKADFGFRLTNMNLQLSQKFPPAMAWEILEYEDKEVIRSSNEKIIELKAGFPELAPIKLEELVFGSIGTQSWNSQSIEPSQRGSLALESDYFTEEEKQRLRAAQSQGHLDVNDLQRAKENSLRDRAATLIQQELSETQENQAPVIVRRQDASASEKGAPPPPSTTNGLRVEGQIEFVRDGSLAMTDQHFIDVRRFEEGVAKEVAQVDLANGTFSMSLTNSRGIIVGRLTNQRGGVEGEGILRVADLMLAKGSKLVLKRVAQRKPIRSRSAYGSKETVKPALALARSWNDSTDSKSTYDVNNFDSSSELLLESEAKDHHPSISIVQLSLGADIELFPDRMVVGLQEIFAEHGLGVNLAQGDSLIWGVVKAGGRPVEGVTVIASGGPTSYFGGFYLPDKALVKTSENGLFVIPVRQSGWHDLYVSLPDGQGFYVNAVVHPGKVTSVVAEAPTEKVPTTLRTFDAFAGEPMNARVEVQQLNEVFEIGPEGAIVLEVPKTQILSSLRVLPGARYEPAHFLYSHFLDFLHLPLIPKEWLDELRSSLKINEDVQSGHIVGFVQGDDFFVEVGNKMNQLKTVYFDPTGQIVERGVKGGGFVLFNVEVETSNLVIVSRRQQREISRIIKPEKDSIQVVQASFE